jgi:hypothetical protein
MRKLILFAALFGLLWTQSLTAQTMQSRRSPHVDSLRRALKLSSNLRLDWRTSKNGADTLHVVDDFNRSDIGPDWAYADGYWQILDGELDLTPAADREWRYLAVFLPIYNSPERQISSVSYRWGRNADLDGIKEGAHALMIDRPDQFGSGYWLWHRTNWFEVWLWIIKDGTWEYTPGEGKEVDRAASQLPANPAAGDVVTAYIRNEPDAVYFDYYVNDIFDATVKDVTKEFPKGDTWYVGAFIHGEELKNQIDDFTVTWVEGDAVGPAAVTDLRAIDSSATSIELEWTSTGDNGVDGEATRLELRYSTAPITAANFANATLAPNLPAPAPSGVKQTFNVINLSNATRYYFAVKLFDEVNNPSPLSNLAQSQTLGSGVATNLDVVNGCNQTGEVNKNLPVQLTAKVTDDQGLGVSNSPVEFVIISGNGTVGGQKNIIVDTDVSGEAKTTWKLGTIAGTQAVEIRAAGLIGSPTSCTATATPAPPSKLNVASGNTQVVSIGRTAPYGLVARLLDKFNNPHTGEAVAFNVVAGPGNFMVGQVNVGKTYQTLTDTAGKALARVAVGNVYGDTTKVAATWKSGATTLTANFITIAAWPDSAIALKGNNQTAARNTILPDSLIVKILDAAKAPVKNYPVTFRILSGGGTLMNNQTLLNLNTDNSGCARTIWKLGNAVGLQEVELKALFNNANLRNTPFIFKATAFAPSAVEENAVDLPKQFALHQNFPNPFAANNAFGSSETTIGFDLPQAAAVEMSVTDVTGRHVRQLASGQMRAGSHRLVWNGRDNYGRPTESGVYFITLRARSSLAAREMTATRKVVLMKS